MENNEKLIHLMSRGIPLAIALSLLSQDVNFHDVSSNKKKINDIIAESKIKDQSIQSIASIININSKDGYDKSGYDRTAYDRDGGTRPA